MADLNLTKPTGSLFSNLGLSIGQAGIYWAERGMVTNATEWTHLGVVLVGTGTITDEAATKTDISVEELDTPIHTIWEKNGGIMYEGDIPDLSLASAKLLLGAEQSATYENVMGLSGQVFAKEGMFWLKPKVGGDGIVFTNASLVANITGNTTKTETLNIHIQVSANAGGGTGFEEKAVLLIGK